MKSFMIWAIALYRSYLEINRVFYARMKELFFRKAGENGAGAVLEFLKSFWRIFVILFGILIDCLRLVFLACIVMPLYTGLMVLAAGCVTVFPFLALLIAPFRARELVKIHKDMIAELEKKADSV